MISKQTGYSTWLFFGLSIIIVFVYLLANVDKCESVEFCATSIFFTIFIGSLFMMVMLSFISPSHHMNQQNIQFFYMQDFSLKKLLWIPLGLGGVFLGSYIGIIANQPFISIFLSGLVMLFAFYHTKAVVIPIIIHGIYNSVVVYLRAGVGNSFIDQIFQNSPINVPNIGLTLGQYTALSSEMIFQIFLVAVAEELFKVFIISYIIVAARGKFDVKSGILTWIAGIGSDIVWTSYHSISAIK